MAEIVQLKNSNGTAIYPVTTGEAINMNNGKTLDQSFNEAKNQILQDISAKKNELASEVEEKKAEFNDLYSDKMNNLDSEFIDRTAELNADFDGKKASLQSDYNNYAANLNIDELNARIDAKAGFYNGSATSGVILDYPIGSVILARTSSTIYHYFMDLYVSLGSFFSVADGDDAPSDSAKKLNGTWANRGQVALGDSFSNNRYVVLVQRIS